ncbi:MAG: hypothetical protein ACERLG_02945 [Sedimentibacter sp.]
MNQAPFKTIIFLLVIIIVVVLQIILSMRKNKWLGLVLPLINILFAAFASFGSMVYTGEIAPIIMVFAMLSIPAIINFVIYLACREKVKENNKQEINKMNIQDLD